MRGGRINTTGGVGRQKEGHVSFGSWITGIANWKRSDEGGRWVRMFQIIVTFVRLGDKRCRQGTSI